MFFKLPIIEDRRQRLLFLSELLVLTLELLLSKVVFFEENALVVFEHSLVGGAQRICIFLRVFGTPPLMRLVRHLGLCFLSKSLYFLHQNHVELLLQSQVVFEFVVLQLVDFVLHQHLQIHSLFVPLDPIGDVLDDLLGDQLHSVQLVFHHLFLQSVLVDRILKLLNLLQFLDQIWVAKGSVILDVFLFDQLSLPIDGVSHELFLSFLNLHLVELVLHLQFAKCSFELDSFLKVLHQVLLDLLHFLLILSLLALAIVAVNLVFLGLVRILQFDPQALNFVSEVIDDALVFRDVELHHFFVLNRVRFDVLGSLGVFQGVEGLLELARTRGYCHYHYGLTISPQRVLQHSRQLGVAIGHERAFFVLVSQGVDAVGQGQKGLVYFGPFSQSQSSVFSHCSSFRASQINQTQFAYFFLQIDISALRKERYLYLENRM